MCIDGVRMLSHPLLAVDMALIDDDSPASPAVVVVDGADDGGDADGAASVSDVVEHVRRYTRCIPALISPTIEASAVLQIVAVVQSAFAVTSDSGTVAGESAPSRHVVRSCARSRSSVAARACAPACAHVSLCLCACVSACEGAVMHSCSR
jgi:hypothetical protein